MPTMVDLCARLREPGQQQHGTLKSEGKAARENGILHVFTRQIPNRLCRIMVLIHGLVEKAMLDGGIYLQVIGAQTQGCKVSNRQYGRFEKGRMYCGF